MAGTSKTKSERKKTTSARRSAAKKTEAAAVEAPSSGAKDTDLDREQHVHTERADAMLPGAPASVVVPSVDELRLQDALSKQKK